MHIPVFLHTNNYFLKPKEMASSLAPALIAAPAAALMAACCTRWGRGGWVVPLPPPGRLKVREGGGYQRRLQTKGGSSIMPDKC